MTAELLILRLIHVVGGVVWVGGATYIAFALAPAIGAAGPAGAPVMANVARTKLFIWLPTIAVLTMLAGVRLMQLTSHSMSSAYFASGPGQGYSAGAVCGLIGFCVEMLIARPSMRKAGMLMASKATAPESSHAGIDAQVATLRVRGAQAGVVSSVLLLLATAAMAVARYL